SIPSPRTLSSESVTTTATSTSTSRLRSSPVISQSIHTILSLPCVAVLTRSLYGVTGSGPVRAQPSGRWATWGRDGGGECTRDDDDQARTEAGGEGERPVASRPEDHGGGHDRARGRQDEAVAPGGRRGVRRHVRRRGSA